jgi:hypothetical protein
MIGPKIVLKMACLQACRGHIVFGFCTEANTVLDNLRSKKIAVILVARSRLTLTPAESNAELNQDVCGSSFDLVFGQSTWIKQGKDRK